MNYFEFWSAVQEVLFKGCVSVIGSFCSTEWKQLGNFGKYNYEEQLG